MKFAPRVYKLEKLHKREPYDRLHYEIHEPDGSIHPGTEAPEDGSRTLIIRYEIVPRPSSMLYVAIAVMFTVYLAEQVAIDRYYSRRGDPTRISLPCPISTQ